MRIGKIASLGMNLWLWLGIFCVTLLLAGCGSGGGEGKKGEDPQNSATITGAVFKPAGDIDAAARPLQLQKTLVAFSGATVEVINLDDGSRYPKNGVAFVDSVGKFEVAGVPFGQHYLIKAKKGNLVMLKLKFIPAGASKSINAGTIDPASTAAALLAEQYIKDALGSAEINLISGPPVGVDTKEFKAAIVDSEPDKLEEQVRGLAADADKIDGSSGSITEELERKLNRDTGDVNIELVAVVNVYLMVGELLKSGDESSDNATDVITDWKNDGVIGVNTQVTSITITVDLTVDERTIMPVDMDQNLTTVSRPNPILGSRPALIANSNSPTFDFTSSKPGSIFQCDLDDSGWVPCTSSRHYPDLPDAVHKFCVKASDPKGVIESHPHCYTWTVDTTPPDTTITGGPANPSGSSTANFAFESSENGSTFECLLDGGGWSSCASPKTYSVLTDGPHTFMVRATDEAGNTDESPASYTWSLDTTAPNTSITDNPPDPSNSGSASFIFTSDESSATFECQMDGGGWSGCTSPKTYTDLSDDSHTFTVRATDAAGNTDATPASYTWTVDTTPPNTLITGQPSDPTNSSSVGFSFISTETGSTFECQMDGGGWSACTSPQNYPGLPDGSHTFEVRATDAAGNTDGSPESFTWTVDTIPPETSISSQPSDPSSSSSASFGFTSSETNSTFECQMDGGGWSSCTTPRDYSGLLDGSHNFDVRATDSAGNTDQSPANYTWTLSQNTDGLVAYYPFNGNANDESGNDHHGTVNGAILTADQFGVLDSAFRFDGNDSITVSDAPTFTLGSDPFTITAWAQLSAYGLDGGYYLMGHSDGPGSTNKWILWLGNNGISFVVGPSPGWISLGNANFEIGRWYHVAIRRNGSELMAFVNGLPIGTADIGSLSIPDPSTPFQIGTAESDRPNRPFRGQMDEIRIYKRALSDIEVLSFFKEGIAYRSDTTPPETTITANPLDPSDSTSASFGFTSNELDSNFQWKVSDGGNGHFYRAIHAPQGISWIDANAAAQAMGGGWHLATINSAAENAFVYSLVNGDPSFWKYYSNNNSEGPWLGGLKVGTGVGGYAWVTGEPFTYTNWGPLEPFGNGDRIGLFGYQTAMGSYWNDVPATRLEFGYIVETSDIMGSPIVSFQCELDGGTYSDCTSPQNYSDLPDGEHTFCVAATDFAGNTDPTPACYTWTVNIVVNLAPVANAGADQTVNNGSVVTLDGTGSSDPNGDTITYSWIQTAGPAVTLSSPTVAQPAFTAPFVTTNTVLTFQLTVSDGSMLSTDTVNIIVQDTTPPDTTITDNPLDPSNSGSASFSFTCSEAVCTFECQLDGGGWSSCTSPKTYTGLIDGNHTFEVLAIDAVGNTDPTPASYAWTVDTIPPVTSITSGPPALSNSNAASFNFDSNEAGATFECQIGGGVYGSCTSPKVYSGLSDGSHTFDVRATDTAGNTDSTPASHTWTVDTTDTTPPANTTAGEFINGGAFEANSATVTLTVSATDNVGVTAYCALDNGTGVEPPAPSSDAGCWVPVSSNPDYSADILHTITNGYLSGTTVYVYVWFKDAAGNISGQVTDSIKFTPTIFSEDFEGGWGTWYADNGVWQVGTPINPAWCNGQCAGTVLDGNYPPDTDSRLISPTTQLPTVSGFEEIHLRFQNWFSYLAYDSGQIQVSVWDPVSGTWGAWGPEGTAVSDTSGWSLKDVDLTAYAGKTVRIAFYHVAGRDCCNASESTGWYIDDIKVVVKVPTFAGDFEGGWGDWGADRGVWQVGTPMAGPTGCYSGSQCTGTELKGNYGAFTDSRLASPTIQLPMITGFEEVHLRFQNWFSYSAYDSGQVQVSVWDPVSGTWGAWVNEGTAVADTSGWSLKDVDLTTYAGKTVRIAFYHVVGRDCCNASESTGWYIDDIMIVKKGPEFTGDFETSWGDWGADRGVWQVGTPAVGPPGCYSGQCAGTELNGNYGAFTDSRLVSSSIQLSDVTGFEEIHLRFQNWISYSSFDSGQVQVSVWDPMILTWGNWINEGTAVADTSGWSLKDVDLTAYAGKTIRIAFYHVAGRDCCNASESTGWYIDDVQVVRVVPTFTGDFESGWGDWGADRGVWQVGTPTAGPVGCYSGTQCSGTELNGNYGAFTDSRLVSPTVQLPAVSGPEGIHLRFQNWFSYSSFDSGQVQVMVWDPVTLTWGTWNPEGTAVTNTSGGWSLKDVLLTTYAGKTVRIAFYHVAGRDCCNASESTGWYIDDIQILKY